jgi:hypothetical protein
METRVGDCPNMVFYKDFTITASGDYIDTAFRLVDVAYLCATGTTGGQTTNPSVVVGTGANFNRVSIYGTTTPTYTVLLIGKA